MEDLKRMINEAIQSIEETTELFYLNKTEAGYERLDNTIVLITTAVNEIFTYQSKGNPIGIVESQLIQVLTEAMKAIQEKDVILLSDILQYELKELFHKVLS